MTINHVYVAKSYGAVWVDINEAYEAYQADPSLSTMIALYDRITYWQTMNAGRDWAAALRPTLEKVKQQIETDVQAETAKQSGGKTKSVTGGMLGKAKTAAAGMLGKGARTARAGAAATATAMKPLLKEYPSWDGPRKPDAAKGGAMEPFLREVGVSQGYYDEHLAGKPDRIAALEAFSTGLKDGHLYAASSAYKKVSNVEGMYLIKPLFLSHFANQANLQGLVGTDAKAAEGKPVSAEELEAIMAYSTQAYEGMNAQLRGHTMRPPGAPRVGRQRMQAQDRKQANDAAAQAATMRMAVAGLDKLPKFQGIAYRMSATVPPGYFAAIRPGGMLADLAFSSASPSMEGVGAFETTQLKGTESKSIYYIIHTRTAVNIVGLSKNAKEGEVLFRPGTRFLVRAVWEHVNGTVPPGAPAQAQMILHYMGETKVSGMRMGGLRAEPGADIGNDINRLKALMNQHPDASVEDLKAQILAEKAQEGKVTKVKVVELVEV